MRRCSPWPCGFLGLVPMVGATLGAVLVAVVALFDDPTKAIIALVYFIVYQQTENYLVAPRIMQRTVSVPGAVTIVAALIGGTLLGMLGALLAIPAAAGLLLLYDEVLVPRHAASNVRRDRPTREAPVKSCGAVPQRPPAAVRPDLRRRLHGPGPVVGDSAGMDVDLRAPTAPATRSRSSWPT